MHLYVRSGALLVTFAARWAGVKVVVFFLNGVGVTNIDVYENVFLTVTSVTRVSNCGLSAVNNATLLIDLAKQQGKLI